MTTELNKDYIRFHLQEASEAALQIMADIESEQDYDIGSYIVDMTHLFHHANTAWNARFATSEQVAVCSEKDYEHWRQYPLDLPIT